MPSWLGAFLGLIGILAVAGFALIGWAFWRGLGPGAMTSTNRALAAEAKRRLRKRRRELGLPADESDTES